MSKFWVLLIISLLLVVQTPTTIYTSINNETVGVHPDFPHARVVVTRVVDGDTIHISPPVCVNGAYRTVVRLADIDAPEPSESGGETSRSALVNLLAQYGNIVYLDIANYTRETGCAGGYVDTAGRAVAVVYVRVNDTYLLNVNRWMVENNYASISDHPDNDFDPNKWSLYLEYHVSAEKLPTVTKVVVCENCNIAYNATWGVRVATTLDRKYLAVAFAEGSPDYTLWVYVLDSNGEIVNRFNYSKHLGSSWYANVFRGMLDIAGNETGFLVAWTNYTRDETSRVVLYSYIPVEGSPTMPSPIYVASNQYHPTVTYFIHSNGTKWWVVGYGRQTTTATNYTLNLLNLTPAYTGRFLHTILAGGATTALDTTPRAGVDIIGGLIYDPVTTNFTIVTRVNKTRTLNVQGGPVDHDLLAIVGRSHGTLGFFLTWYDVDNRAGDQGPEPEIYLATQYYSYYNLFPSIFSKLLGSGRYVLTVYNESATSLAYAIIDLQPTTPTITRGTLFDRGLSTTFYPWITANGTHWLVAWSAGVWVNASFVKPVDPYVENLLVVADSNASYVRTVFDDSSKLYAIVYAVTDHTDTRNIYVAFYNATKGMLEPWVLPVATNPGVHETPLHVVTLAGSPNKLVVVALEGNNLVAYYVSREYPEMLNPVPIPEPWIATIVIIVASIAIIVLFTRRLLIAGKSGVFSL